jgi:hypothetical protein
MVPLAVIQVRVRVAPGVTVGIAPELVTDTEAVLVQPFAGSVTVTVYVPAAFTVGEEVVPPDMIPGPDQFHVTPGVVEVALIVPVGAAQVKASDEPGVTLGCAVLLVTLTTAVLVHPFDGSVTVTE